MGVLSTTDDNEVDIRSSHSENFRSSVGYRSAYFWSKPELCAITMTASSTNAVTAPRRFHSVLPSRDGRLAYH